MARRAAITFWFRSEARRAPPNRGTPPRTRSFRFLASTRAAEPVDNRPVRRPSPLLAALPLAGALIATRAAALPAGSGGRCAPLDDLAHAPPPEPARGVDEPLAPPPADTASYTWDVRLDPSAHTLEGTGSVTCVKRICASLN